MANIEGVYRIRRIGKMITLLGTLFTAVGGILFAVAWFTSPGISRYGTRLYPSFAITGMMVVLYLGIFPVVLGGILQLVAWIAEGFLQPETPR